jgi:hypothetical protein
MPMPHPGRDLDHVTGTDFLNGPTLALERAPGSKVTRPPDTREGAIGGNMGSTRTEPVNHSTGPLADGCEPGREILSSP